MSNILFRPQRVTGEWHHQLPSQFVFTPYLSLPNWDVTCIYPFIVHFSGSHWSHVRKCLIISMIRHVLCSLEHFWQANLCRRSLNIHDDVMAGSISHNTGHLSGESQVNSRVNHPIPWWRHQMEPFSALLCGEITGPGEFPTQRPVTRSFDIVFNLRLNKRLSKQP